jgi:predicted RNA binding protein YcfA (HicA-like mRNA interferase family)
MKYSELWKILKAAGWKQIHGRKHDLAVNPENPDHLIPVPRHKDEVPSGTAHSILKEAGLK